MSGTQRGFAHAIIVLGAGVLKSGAPSPPLERRIRAAVDLHKSLEDSVLVCAGGVGRHGPSEASVMRRIALSEGVDDSCILLEEESRNTRENIRNSLNVLDESDRLTLHIVSDGSHLPRCRMYAALAGIRAEFHAVPAHQSRESRTRYIGARLYEAAAFVKYAAVGLIDRFR